MNTAPADATPAIIEKNVTNTVLKGVHKLMDSKTLFLPADYSVENALRSAWFAIQNSDQKDKILACTQESQANALYDMVIQALDVSKKQGYFIPYGNRLTFQRSYFGDEAVARRVRPGIEIYYDVIYEGEVVKVTKEITRYGYVKKITHEPAFPRLKKGIIGAYCGAFDENGEHMGAEIMDMDQIKQSWKKSKTYGEKSQTFHNEQPDQACIRTVIRRRCKAIINSSNDAALLDSIRRQEIESSEAEIDEEIEGNANGETITVSALTGPQGVIEVLDEAKLRERLSLNGDEWTHLKDEFTEKSDDSFEGFLNACLAGGCTNYKTTIARIMDLPDKPKAQAQAAPAEDLGY